MDKRRLLAIIASVLGTLAETPEGCPESTLYLACGLDLESWQRVRNALRADGLISVSGAHWIKATPKGTKVGAECNAAIAEAKAKVAG